MREEIEKVLSRPTGSERLDLPSHASATSSRQTDREMLETKVKRSRETQALVAMAVGLAFLLQMAFVSLHLAGNHHFIGSESPERGPFEAESVSGNAGHGHDGHAHRGHRHGSEDSRPDDPDPEHDPHPAQDHIDEFFELAESTPPSQGCHALLPQGVVALDPLLPQVRRVEELVTPPRPPPPRSSPPSRAPPIVT